MEVPLLTTEFVIPEYPHRSDAKPANKLPEVKLWVCEDTTCIGQALAKLNPLDCPQCGEEMMLAPLSKQGVV
jgi:hypothetical protein